MKQKLESELEKISKERDELDCEFQLLRKFINEDNRLELVRIRDENPLIFKKIKFSKPFNMVKAKEVISARIVELSKKNSKLQERIGQIREALEKEEEKEETKQEIMNVVNGIIEQVRYYLPFAKEVVNISKQDVLDIVKLLLATGIDLRKGLDKELASFSEINAKAEFRDYTNYVKAGFDAQQAFQLVLAKNKSIDFTKTFDKAIDQVASKVAK